METTKPTPYEALTDFSARLAAAREATRHEPYVLRLTPTQFERVVEGLICSDDEEDVALGVRLREESEAGGRTIDATEEPEVVGEYDDGPLRESHAATAADHNRSRP